MGFKEQVVQDIDSLFNIEEFAEPATIDGKEYGVIIDDDRLKERTEKDQFGISTGMILYLIPVSCFSKRPSIGDQQTFNHKSMYIQDVSEQDGVFEIILSQNRGG